MGALAYSCFRNVAFEIVNIYLGDKLSIPNVVVYGNLVWQPLHCLSFRHYPKCLLYNETKDQLQMNDYVITVPRNLNKTFCKY